MNKTITQAVLYGGTGQAKVVRPILEAQGIRVIAVFDDTPDLPVPFADIKLLRGKKEISDWLENNRDVLAETGFCITIGNPHGKARCQLHEKLQALGMWPLTVIHPDAIVDESATLGEGCQIMAGAVVGVDARLGKQCIINTRASVDHECILENGVELAPGAILCGLINIDKYAWICAGATVLPRVSIGKSAIVGAGCVVTKNVDSNATVVGVPARTLETK